jgi:RHH-type transcriptional regulator, rel operon repressor / antitoxin RelB
MPTSVRLPKDAEKRLNELAAVTGRTKAFYIKEAILSQLDVLEDVYLAEGSLERIRKGEERTYTIDEVEKDLGLAG